MENGNAYDQLPSHTISASWQLQVQLLKMTMVTGLLLMGNGNAYDHLSFLDPAAGAGT